MMAAQDGNLQWGMRTHDVIYHAMLDAEMLMKNLFSTAQFWSTGSFKVLYVHFLWDLALYMWIKA